MMKKQDHGFIFLMTLIVTAIMSLLTLTSMNQIALYFKAMNKQHKIHHNFYQLEAVALQLVRHVDTNHNCMSSQDAANQVVEKLLHFEGCALKQKGSDYRYFIEDLGMFPCLVVPIQNLKYASYHRRISVLRMEEGIPESLIQIRFITQGARLPCFSQERVISVGVVSWRYLSLLGTKQNTLSLTLSPKGARGFFVPYGI
jgi:hypothetical protein